MALVADYLGCQLAMCPSCPHLAECPLHNRIQALETALRDIISDKPIPDVRGFCKAALVGPKG